MEMLVHKLLGIGTNRSREGTISIFAIHCLIDLEIHVQLGKLQDAFTIEQGCLGSMFRLTAA